jgi:excisionase family DNA binding protein
MEPMLLTAEQTAKTLSISERTLWSLRERGEIRAVRIGRRVLYSTIELQRFIDSQLEKAS